MDFSFSFFLFFFSFWGHSEEEDEEDDELLELLELELEEDELLELSESEPLPELLELELLPELLLFDELEDDDDDEDEEEDELELEALDRLLPFFFFLSCDLSLETFCFPLLALAVFSLQDARVPTLEGSALLDSFLEAFTLSALPVFFFFFLTETFN